MSTKTSETFDRMASIPRERTSSPRAGWVIFGFGALYMLLLGWLSSWWVVPIIRQAGLEGLPGAAFFYFWQVAAPVGALLVTIGAAFLAGVERTRKAAIIGGSLVVVIWLFVSMGAIRQVIPPIFGIGGGLISLAFLGSAWDWAHSRPGLASAARTGADLGMAGQVFYLIAAWYLCGLLGAPTFLLRPEQALTIMPENTAISLGTTVLICMTLGSLFTFWSRRVRLQVKA
ncbi:MAG TPA: hypothetical protein VLA49_17845 [Anaerolineales bacterium]|nr:hypothetical protein [Anaerolineales bacterium]